MDARQVIKRPIITEESVYNMDDKVYTFEVDRRSNKSQIKHALEEIFGVEVEKVNTANLPTKLKRMGMHSGYTNKRKKAIVTLTEASKDIQIFAEQDAEDTED